MMLKYWGAIWWVQALVIAAFTATILNGCPFLPFFRDIKPRRIEARWVGYVGLTSAFLLWLALGPHRPAWQAVMAWAIIMLVTLVANTLIHWRDRDTKNIRLLLTQEGEALLGRWLRDHAPDDPELRDLFMSERTGETAEELWLDAMAPWAGMLSESDTVLMCLVQAVKQEWNRESWILAAIATLVDLRPDICKAKNRASIWYELFFPEYAR